MYFKCVVLITTCGVYTLYKYCKTLIKNKKSYKNNILYIIFIIYYIIKKIYIIYKLSSRTTYKSE